MKDETPEMANDGNFPDRRHAGLTVLLVVFGASLLLGVYTFRILRISERHITRIAGELSEKGKALDPEGCVDEIVAWIPNCVAMWGLCINSVPRLMLGCLRARDREAFCEELGDRGSSTSFGYAQCEARKVSLKSRNKKACAMAYRAIDAYCKLAAYGESGGASP